MNAVVRKKKEMDRTAAIIVGVCILLSAVVLAAPGKFSSTDGRTSGNVESTSARYQMVATSGVNVFVIDTRTGRVWRKFVASTEGPTSWSEESTPWATE